MSNVLGGLSIAAVLGGLFWLLEHHDIYDGAKALLVKPFIRGHKKIQQFYLANHLQSKLNGFSRRVSLELEEKKQLDVKIQWVTATSREAFFRDNQLVIKMDCDENANKNFSYAALAYVSTVFLRDVKPYIDLELQEAIDLMSTKKIIDTSANSNEKDYFNNVLLFPRLASGPALEKRCSDIQLLDQKGYYTRLFIRELRQLGHQLSGSIPNNEVRTEIREFFEWMVTLGHTRLVDAEGVLLTPGQFRFNRRYLKVQVILLAVYANRESENLVPYRRRIKRGIQDGLEIFYILASELSFGLIKLLEEDIQHRLVRQKILVKSSDRIFKVMRSAHEKVRHRCIVYRAGLPAEDVVFDSTWDELPAEADEDVVQPADALAPGAGDSGLPGA